MSIGKAAINPTPQIAAPPSASSRPDCPALFFRQPEQNAPIARPAPSPVAPAQSRYTVAGTNCAVSRPSAASQPPNTIDTAPFVGIDQNSACSGSSVVLNYSFGPIDS